jgi:hypothetical protein
MGLKVIIDMAKLNVPFQFNCSVTTPKKNPRESRRSAPGGLVHGGVDPLLQDPQRGID